MTEYVNRSAVLVHHVRFALRNSSLKMSALAADIVDHYHRTVPLRSRTVHFHLGGDPYSDAEANEQIVARALFADSVRMPVDLEESVVLSLPEPFRSALQRDLAARLGLLAAPLPRSDGARRDATTSDLLRETGELLTQLSTILADGRVDAKDMPHVARALHEVLDVQGVLVGIEHQLREAQAQSRLGGNVQALRGAA